MHLPHLPHLPDLPLRGLAAATEPELRAPDPPLQPS